MRGKALLLMAVAALCAGQAAADWVEEDGHKMHYPQLPDVTGYDIRANYYVGLADDFQCKETGLITDIHIWGSWKGDDANESEITTWHLALYENVPDDDGAGPNFSHPGERLWHDDSYRPTVKEWLPADVHWQAWWDPSEETGGDNPLWDDHEKIYQCNFFLDEADAFEQIEGTIYWLEVSPILPLNSTRYFGWKNSASQQFMDDAVWRQIVPDYDPNSDWSELRDPNEPALSLDLAFVITPEPAVLSVLGLGVLAVIRRRRRTR